MGRRLHSSLGELSSLDYETKCAKLFTETLRSICPKSGVRLVLPKIKENKRRV